MSSGKKVTVGMLVLALSGLILGAVIGYIITNSYASAQTLAKMEKEGYVLTTDATATADDIVRGASAYVNGELIEGNVIKFDTSDATATSSQIVRGKTAYVNGQLVVGTLPTYDGIEVTPTTADFIIEGGQYLSGEIVIQGDANLVGTNIRRGIYIFNVAGMYQYTPPVQDEEGGGE